MQKLTLFYKSLIIRIPNSGLEKMNPNPIPNPKNSSKSQTIRGRNPWDPNPKNIIMKNLLNRNKEGNPLKTEQTPIPKF